MNFKVAIFASIFFLINGKAIENKKSRSVCEDSQAICKLIPSIYCDRVPFLKTTCPFTCGQCGDPCSMNNGGCSQFCSGKTEAQCSCRGGFELLSDGRTCIDINECSAKTNPCRKEGKECINTVGSYSCQFLKCENFENIYSNYYKSDSCCKIESKKLPSESDLSKEEARFASSLNNDFSSQWPWTAQILIASTQQSDSYEHRCGGVLIAKNWIATSSLCIKNVELKSLKIVLGHVNNAQLTNSPKETRQERSVGKIITHPDATNNDIALLQLSQSVHFNQLIQPVSLPCGESPPTYETCYVTGFGVKGNTPESTPTQSLKEIPVTVSPSPYCEIAFGPRFNSETMLCAGVGEETQPGFGDGGSPMVCQRADSCQWYLSGLVSIGRGTGNSAYPDVYTRIVHVEKWIRTELGSDFVGSCN